MTVRIVGGLAAIAVTLASLLSACSGLDGTIGDGGAGGATTSTSTGVGPGGTGGAGGTPDPAEPLFAGTSIPRFDLSVSEEALAQLAATPYEYVIGDVKLTLDGKEIELPSTGVRLKGRYGSYRPLENKSAFLLKFDKETKSQTLFGIEKLALNNMVQDPSMIHERIGYTLFRDIDVAAPRTAWARVYLNGQLYGLYATVEATDNTEFLERWFGSDDGNLYEGEYGSDLFLGSEASFDQDNGINLNFKDLTELATALDGMTNPATFWDDASKVIDMDEYVRFAAAELFLGHWDGYAKWRNNYFIYRRPSDQRWVFLPWGIDQTFSDRIDPWAAYGRVQEMCVASSACRLQLAKAYELIIARVTALDLADKAAALESLIWDAVVEDPRKEYDNQTVSNSIADAVNFLKTRGDEVKAKLVCADPNAVDADKDGSSGCGQDCDDNNPNIHPNAPELCNFADENCNGVWDDDPSCPQCVSKAAPNGTTFAFCFGVRNWTDAEADCVAQGGHLASIRDQAERDFVATEAYAISGGDWWLGLTDAGSEGTFAWTDGSPLEFTHWTGGEPNNWGGNENCGHMAEWAGSAWNDAPCEMGARYVCRMP